MSASTETIRNGQAIRLNILPGESVIVAAVTGTYNASIVQGAGLGVIATAATSATYGPYASGIAILLTASAASEIDYAIAVTPVIVSDTFVKINASGTALVDPVTGGLRPLPDPNGEVHAAQFGIISHATLDQTAAIVAMDAALALISFGGKILWPTGTICFTGPISITSGRLGRFFYQQSDTYKTPPAFVGDSPNGTKFVMLNPATTNATGFIFSVTTTEVAAGIARVLAPKFENVSFAGQGTTALKTTLNTAIIAGDTSLSLVGAIAVVGDAIAVINGTKKHWATVKTVSGAGPQTVTIDARQAMLSAIATAGTTVLLFKQTRLVQFGGTLTANSTIVQEVRVKNVRVTNAFQGFCCDDTTQFMADGLTTQGVVHGVSYGYNCDSFTFNDPYVGSDQPTISATCTSGLNVITGTGIDTLVNVGSKVWDAAALPTLRFPEHTYVISKTTNSVTLSENYTGANGVRTITVAGTGVLIANGQGETAFLGNYTSNTLNNYTATLITNPLGGRAEALARCGDTVGIGFTCDAGYLEVFQRVLVNGVLGGTGSGGLFKFDNLVVQGADSCIGAPFEDFLGGASKWDLTVAAAGTPVFPLLQTTNYTAKIKLGSGWDWQNATAATAFGQVSPAIINLDKASDVGVSITQGQAFDYNYGGGAAKQEGSRGASIVKTGHTGAFNWNWPGISVIDLTLAAASNMAAIIYGLPPAGYRVKLVLRNTGAFAFTFPALASGTGYWRTANVDAAVVIAGTPANGTNVTMLFESDGAALRLVGNQTPTWIAAAAA